MFGALGISAALICEAVINSQNPGGSLSIASVAFLFLVSIIFSVSFGPISWVYMPEVMPMQIRARGNAFATGIGNWLVATLFAQVSPRGLGPKPSLCKSSGNVPNARSPNSKLISSRLTCFVSLKKKNTTGKVTTKLNATKMK